MQRFLLILSLLHLFEVFHCQVSMTVNPWIKTVNQETSYQFIISDPSIKTVISNSAVIQISFPSPAFNFNSTAPYRCLNTDNISIVYPCVMLSNKIQIYNPPVNVLVFKLTISPIRNPTSVQSVTFGYRLVSMSNGTIISQGPSEVFNGYTPGSLGICIISLSPNVTYENTQMTITITPNTNVPDKGSIQVDFPEKWLDTLVWDTNPIIPLKEKQQCRILTTRLNLFHQFQCLRVGNSVKLANIINGSAVARIPIKFSINNVLSPPSYKLIREDKIVVKTMTSTNALIDKRICYINNPNPKLIEVNRIGNNLIVGKRSELFIQFIAPSPIGQGDTLEIYTSQGINVNFSQISIDENVQISYGNQRFLIIPESVTEYTLRLKFLQGTRIGKQTRFRISKGVYLKPLTPSGVNLMRVVLLRGNASEYANASVILPIYNEKVLRDVTVELSSYVVSAMAVYTFRFIIANELKPRSRIQIVFPYRIRVPSDYCKVAVEYGNNNSIEQTAQNCMPNYQMNSIEIQLNNNYMLAVGEQLTLQIGQLTNSQSTEPNSNLEITTFSGSDSSDSLDASPNLTVTMEPATIQQPLVLLYQKGDSLQIGIFYTVKTSFIANSILRISTFRYLPYQNITFAVSIITNQAITQQHILQNTLISIDSQQFIQLKNISSTYLPPSTVIMIKISSLTNVTNIQNSSHLKIILIDPKQYAIEQYMSTVSIQVIQLAIKNATHNQLSSLKINEIPFLLCFSVAIIAIFCGIIKLSQTSISFSQLLSCIIGVMEVLSWLQFLITINVYTLTFSTCESYALSIQLILSTIALNLTINIIAVVFVLKFALKNDRHQILMHVQKEKNAFKKPVQNLIILLSTIVSNKLLFMLLYNEKDNAYHVFNQPKRVYIKKIAKRGNQYLSYLILCSILPSIFSIATGAIPYFFALDKNQINTILGSLVDMIIISFSSLVMNLCMLFQQCLKKSLKIHAKIQQIQQLGQQVTTEDSVRNKSNVNSNNGQTPKHQQKSVSTQLKQLIQPKKKRTKTNKKKTQKNHNIMEVAKDPEELRISNKYATDDRNYQVIEELHNFQQ